MKKYISVKEGAARLGISRVWLRYLIQSGLFKDVRRGTHRSYWITEKELIVVSKRIAGKNRLIQKGA